MDKAAYASGTMPHPVIRLGLTLLAAAAATAGDGPLLLLIITLAGLYVRLGAAMLGAALRVVGRLRYFYLSLLILYGWFSGGSPLLPAWPVLSPSAPGLWQGLRYCAALAAIVLAVQALVRTTERAELVAALRWWLNPLAWIGLDPTRLALRLVLAMETVPRLRQWLADTPRPASGGRLRQWAGAAAAVVSATHEAAEHDEPPLVRVPRLGAAPPREWLLLCLTAGALAVVAAIG